MIVYFHLQYKILNTYNLTMIAVDWSLFISGSCSWWDVRNYIFKNLPMFSALHKHENDSSGYFENCKNNSCLWASVKLWYNGRKNGGSC